MIDSLLVNQSMSYDLGGSHAQRAVWPGQCLSGEEYIFLQALRSRKETMTKPVASS